MSADLDRVMKVLTALKLDAELMRSRHLSEPETGREYAYWDARAQGLADAIRHVEGEFAFETEVAKKAQEQTARIWAWWRKA